MSDHMRRFPLPDGTTLCVDETISDSAIRSLYSEHADRALRAWGDMGPEQQHAQIVSFMDKITGAQ